MFILVLTRFARRLKGIEVDFLLPKHFLPLSQGGPSGRKYTYIVLVGNHSKPLKSLQTDAVGRCTPVVKDGAHETQAFCIIVMKLDTTDFTRSGLSFCKMWAEKSLEDRRGEAQDLGLNDFGFSICLVGWF